MTEPLNAELVYIAPSEGRSGVGDYATDFLNAVEGHFSGVTQYRIETDGAETIRDVLSHARAIRRLVRVKQAQGPVVVHLEQSAGSLSTFWAVTSLGAVPVTATIHDAPQPVWWPFKFALLTRNRYIHHGVHYPLRPLWRVIQRQTMKGRSLITLTSIGAEETRRELPQSDVVASRIFIPARPPALALTRRPLAVGLFGHVYKGKGFDLVGRLREQLDDEIEIRVAGRGTENLPSMPGVSILGEVNGHEEDQFFDSIRFLVVPYSKDNRYGRVWAASSAVSRSYAYGTPIVCVLDGSLSETAVEGGAIGVQDGIDGIADAVNKFIRDDTTMLRLEDEISALQQARALEQCILPFLDTWRQLLNGD